MQKPAVTKAAVGCPVGTSPTLPLPSESSLSSGEAGCERKKEHTHEQSLQGETWTPEDHPETSEGGNRNQGKDTAETQGQELS